MLKDSKLGNSLPNLGKGGASERNISGARLPDDTQAVSTAHNTSPANPDSTIQQPESISASGANVRGGHASIETRDGIDLAVTDVIPEEPSHAAEMPPPRSRHSSDRRSHQQQ